jgi:hypothetical protein
METFGAAGKAFFDVWTLAHLGFWIFVASTAWGLGMRLRWAFPAAMLGAFGWEVLERYLEAAKPEMFQNPEVWYNSWLSDPLTTVVAVLGWWVMLGGDRKKTAA